MAGLSCKSCHGESRYRVHNDLHFSLNGRILLLFRQDFQSIQIESASSENREHNDSVDEMLQATAICELIFSLLVVENGYGPFRRSIRGSN